MRNLAGSLELWTVFLSDQYVNTMQLLWLPFSTPSEYAPSLSWNQILNTNIKQII